jgi:CubicO group peptidase (beta-lactamase class C family)
MIIKTTPVLILFSLLLWLGSASKPPGNHSLNKFIGEYMKDHHVPGLAFAIIGYEGVRFSKAYGRADVENDKPMSVHSLMNIASISKTVTATAVMQLWERGQVSLEEDISVYLPVSIRNPHFPEIPVTIRQLLTHTSSIMDGPAYVESYSCGDPEISLKEWITGYLCEEGSYYDANGNFLPEEPGKEHQYSNVGYGLLGYLVEEVTDMPFNRYCREHIFTPLGMERSAWFLSEIEVGDHATLYFYVSAGAEQSIKNNYKQLLIGEQDLSEGQFAATCLYSFPNYPDGLLRTSVIELSNFLMAFMNGGAFDGKRILKSSTVDKMLSLQVEGNPSQGLCWHQSDFESLWGHGGGDPGVQTKMFFSPITKTGVIIFQNSSQGSQFELLKRIYHSALTGI